MRFPLHAGEELTVHWVESQVLDSSARVVDTRRGKDGYDFAWLMSNVIETNGPFADDPRSRGDSRCPGP